MDFPSVNDVRNAVFDVSKELGRGQECDVRLQVYPDGQWAVRWGLSDYDQDHRGYWGAGSVASRTSLSECNEIAHDLISQAQDDAAQNGEEA